MAAPPPPTQQPRPERAIQRARGLESDLRAFDRSTEAEYLDRLAGDADLILRLQLTRFDRSSDDWRAVASALIGYGYDVFRSWFGTGKIHAMLKQKNVHGRQALAGYGLQPGEEHDLAADLMLDVVDRFREKLASGAWRPDGGASLKTFFVTFCLFNIPRVFKASTRDQSRSVVTAPESVPSATVAGGEARVEMRLIVEQELRKMPERTRRMFELQNNGLELKAIAAKLGTTEPTVRSVMSRARRSWPANLEFPWAS